MKLLNRQFWLFAAIATGIVILFTLIAAPSNNQLSRGSTYSRSPEGYGAWYAYMEKRGTPVQRWQKPFSQLEGQSGITLLRVNSDLSDYYITNQEEKWLKQGNELVILGIRRPVTKAEFSTLQESLEGAVRIRTRRRYNKNLNNPDENINKPLLGDRFGAVVWEEKRGRGRAILATTSYLAANAYQDAPGNYEFLAKLLTQSGKALWVDEYAHGYRDEPEKAARRASREELWDYLAKTPLAGVLWQALIILAVATLAGNRRFGQPQTLAAPAANNSLAYIQALAGVLRKAESSNFVAEVVGKEEQMQLQKALGLGAAPLEPDALVNAWVQQTGRAPAELEQLLRQNATERRIREQDLLIWLGKWQKVRQHLEREPGLGD